MKPWIRKWGIYITTLLSSSAVNIIAPFYSKVAEDQGIHPWLIGIIYASCPLAAFISSCYIPRHLEKIGRTTVLCTGLIIVGLSNIILVFLPNSSYSTAVFLSFLSRIAEGVGCSFCMITANTTLTSDYPEDLTKIIATIEIMSGIGLSAGPALGSVIFKLFGFKSTCLVIGCSILCYSPLLFLIIGKSRIYKKTNDKIDLKIILSKKKILLDMGMQITVMFSVGFFVPITQLYLVSEGVDQSDAGYWYSSETASYMVASMVLARISTTWNRPKQMIIGNFVMVLAFLMLGPCPLFFHKSLSWNLSGLLMIGLGCALIYIPSMPHMIQVAQEDYGFGSDDRLNDAIAGITNISLCLGEFFGPLAASALYEPVGFRYGTSVISVLILLFGLFYLKNCEFSRSLLKVNPVDSELVLM